MSDELFEVEVGLVWLRLWSDNVGGPADLSSTLLGLSVKLYKNFKKIVSFFY